VVYRGPSVTFLRVDSWAEERPPAVPDAVLRLLDHRWLRNGVALAVSLVLDAGLIMALVSLGQVELPGTHQVQQSIATFDIASLSAQTQGAASRTAAVTPATPPSSTPAASPPPHPEWSMTTLPPAPAPMETAVPAPAPARAAATPAQGLAASGTGSGAGYDPYAFASYRRPDPVRLNANQTLQPLPEAVTHLSMALGLSSAAARRQIGVRIYVDPMGRIVRAEALSGAPVSLAERLASVAPGFQLCNADSTRPPETSLMVTLTI